jgi:GT2 family glycosyltransferase
MPDCSIIMPVHNKASLTRQCLDALFACGEASAFEVVVVNDASTDGTAELLAGYGDRIRLLTHETNAGFANTCNDGARLAQGKYLVFLNNDTVPLKGWLDKLVAYAEKHPAAAVVGTKMLFPDGSIQHAGAVICQDYGCRHIYAGFPGDHPAVNKSRRFQVVTAGCALFRREPFEQAGGFDPVFFNGYEDVDLCLRLGAMGHEIHYCHESVLYHLESVITDSMTGHEEREHRNYLLYRSRWAHRIQPDDIRYYIEDGLLRITYNQFYPLEVRLSPTLGLLTGADCERETDRLLNARARQVYDLLRETVRLSVRVKEAEFEAARNGKQKQPPVEAPAPAEISPAEVELISRGEVHWLSPETSGRVISVILPIKNAATQLRQILPRVLSQKCNDQVEFVAVDSGSSDDTLDVLRQYAATIVSIPPAAFDHGLTRNLATRYARGNVYVFLTKTALPADDRWLANLVAPLDQDPLVAGVCSRTQPKPDADFLTYRDVMRDPDSSPERQVRVIGDREEYRALDHAALRLLINFHTQGTAIRPEVFARVPFRRILMGEDILWAKEVLEAGYKIQHEPSAVVLHSHNYSFQEIFLRNFDDGFVNQQVVGRTFADEDVIPVIEELVREDWEYLKNECELTGENLERWQQISSLRRTAQTVGEWLGVNHRRFKGDLVSFCSLTARLRADAVKEQMEPMSV